MVNKLLMALVIGASMALAGVTKERPTSGKMKPTSGKDSASSFKPPAALIEARNKKKTDGEVIEDIVDHLSVKDQINFMIDHLKAEEEAEGRKDQFDSITYDGANDVGDGKVIQEEHLSEVAEEWTEDWNAGKSYEGLDDYYANDDEEDEGFDKEDLMTEDEWLDYYDENVAQSGADEERIAELEMMKEQLEDSEKIDVELEKVILAEVIDSIQQDQVEISTKAEIDYIQNAQDYGLLYLIYCSAIGVLVFVFLLVRKCKGDSAAKDDQQNGSTYKPATVNEDLEMTNASVDHF